MTGTDFTVRSTISAKLQKREAYSNDSWTTVTTYSAIGVASCSLNKTKTIESGYEYRVVGTFTGMSSSGTTETQTKYSAILP